MFMATTPLRNFLPVFTLALIFNILTPAFVPAADDVPQNETEQLDFAQGLLARGLYTMAVAEYQKFIAEYPQSTYLEEANLAIGESYFLAQDFPNAVTAFNHFKELYPNGANL